MDGAPLLPCAHVLRYGRLPVRILRGRVLMRSHRAERRVSRGRKLIFRLLPAVTFLGLLASALVYVTASPLAEVHAESRADESRAVPPEAADAPASPYARLLGRVSRQAARSLCAPSRLQSQDPSPAVGCSSGGAVVAAAQLQVARLGFSPGASDGLYGLRTASAISEYQEAFFEAPTGVLMTTQSSVLRQRVQSLPEGEHSFPVAGAWRFGGPSGRYGDDRSTYRHGGQDIAAAQGTPLVAVVNGSIKRRAYQARGAGYYVILAGDDGHDYVYMHMPEHSSVAEGTRVSAGQALGAVGSSGKSSGPHLHFEMWRGPWFDGGERMDPLPALLSWR